MTIQAISPPSFAPAPSPIATGAPLNVGSSSPAPTDPFATLLEAASMPTSPSMTTAGMVSGLSPTQLPSSLQLETGGTSSSPVVAQAEQFLGTPYVWGGSSPTQGFDCSGLVQYVFGQLGVALPRTSEQQAQVGSPVSNLAAAQPGDLLFFEPGQNGAPASKPGHVAIYLGNGEMIAAPRAGQSVQIQAVPGEPFEIRRVALPFGSPTPSIPDTSVQMGNVSVPLPYAGLVEQASLSSGVPSSLLAAVLQTESSFQPSAVSGAGAEGIAQFLPSTASAAGINPFDPSQAINGAANLLGQFHAAFGSWPLAVAAYTAGGGAVQAAGGIPQDGTTPNYVSNVLALAGPGSVQ